MRNKLSPSFWFGNGALVGAVASVVSLYNFLALLTAEPTPALDPVQASERSDAWGAAFLVTTVAAVVLFVLWYRARSSWKLNE